MASASTEFREWLDTVATDTSVWFQDENDTVELHPYFSNADVRYRKQEGYRQKWLESQDWYKASLAHAKRIMELEESELGIEEPLTLEQEGFWDQFDNKK